MSSRREQLLQLQQKKQALKEEYAKESELLEQERKQFAKEESRLNSLIQKKEQMLADIKRLESLKEQLEEQCQLFQVISQARDNFGSRIKKKQEELYALIQEEVAEYTKCAEYWKPPRTFTDVGVDTHEIDVTKLAHLSEVMEVVHNRLMIIKAKTEEDKQPSTSTSPWVKSPRTKRKSATVTFKEERDDDKEKREGRRTRTSAEIQIASDGDASEASSRVTRKRRRENDLDSN